MLALFQENGPFTVAPDGTTLLPNPYTWNAHYHMLYIDNPVGAVRFAATRCNPMHSQAQPSTANVTDGIRAFDTTGLLVHAEQPRLLDQRERDRRQSLLGLDAVLPGLP